MYAYHTILYVENFNHLFYLDLPEVIEYAGLLKSHDILKAKF